MHCLSIISQLLLASTLTTALANPHGGVHTQISQRDPPTDSVPKLFHLKTRVQAGGDQSKNDLYVGVRHIGAAQNAVVLQKEAQLLAWFKGKDFQFTSSDSEIWGFQMNEVYTYDQWLPVQINPFRPHTTNFELRNSVLVWLSPSFRGWLVCDWALGEPQLFRKTDRFDDRSLHPSNCSPVELLAEFYWGS